jgi:hypothetical protein
MEMNKEFKDPAIESLYQLYKNANKTLDEIVYLVKDISGRGACGMNSRYRRGNRVLDSDIKNLERAVRWKKH